MISEETLGAIQPIISTGINISFRTFHEKDGARSGCREGIATCGRWTLSTAHGISRNEIKSREQDRVGTPEAVGRTYRQSQHFRFRRKLELDWGVSLPDYAALHAFSLDEMEKFWSTAWDFCRVVASKKGERVLVDGDKMPGAQFFPDARLNFAENLLRRRDDTPAILFRAEDQIERKITWNELYDETSRMAQALRALGVEAGDRVAGFVPNCPEAIIAMLAASSIGAIWTSCSPDFGVQGVLDRFGQVKPKVLFTADGYHYNGKPQDSLEKTATVLANLPSVQLTVVFPLLNEEPEINAVPNSVHWRHFTAAHDPENIDFAQLPFNHPLYILYSSGTTGAPKCIVHGAGGTLLQHLKEQQLHCDIKKGDRAFYFTTCGWMMWNWLVTFLASEATVVLYDGSPFLSGPGSFVRLCRRRGDQPLRHIGQVHRCARQRQPQADGHTRPFQHPHTHLDRLAFGPEGFDYVYANIKKDVCLSSIAGGTDIVGCFVGGNPTLPVWQGEIQCKLMGMATEVFNEDGQSVVGEKGELVCTKPFPSMPLGFWNDDDGAKYRSAYFDRFDNIWHHGDFVELTERGGMIIFGRSDATLNPGGVRIGTAEIYRQVEQFSEVVEAICIGQEWDDDTRVVLFVVLRDSETLDDDLTQQIRQRVRQNCSPRHMPAKVIAVTDIPRTKSGKITELAVRDIVHGRDVKNKEALDNPEALELYRDLAELQNG